MISPVWKEKEGRWRIQARKDGKVFSFSSSVPGPKGRKEVLRKYENWYYGEASGDKTVKKVAEEFDSPHLHQNEPLNHNGKSGFSFCLW